MRSRLARFALLFIMMMFFAALALDIAVPATVLGVMALVNGLLLSGEGGWKEETA
ncbi:hypothetical protein [Metarhizobium album]|uniref:hypothetical protein n=1 Tax=Metarhizobium album TaxID=2182425 RepID=UPI000ADF9FA2|nr:hypothetical protein [Rhizobium album]